MLNNLTFQANDRDVVGLTREEAVTYLTSLDGNVTMLVQYKKEGNALFLTVLSTKSWKYGFKFHYNEK